MAETQRLCEAAGPPQGLRVPTHFADVFDTKDREDASSGLSPVQGRISDDKS
jgi:hypothetical protein